MPDNSEQLTRRKRQHLATQEEIKQAAWQQVGELGASSLSLRAVASAIGVSAPALYRYFPSKNHLVTALIIDAFESLSESQNQALARTESEAWPVKLRGLGLAYRNWSLANRAAFHLIFGDPVPGYEPPWDQTMPIAGNSLGALITVIDQAHKSGKLGLPLAVPATPSLLAALKAWSDTIHHVHPEILYLAFVITCRVQGLMMVELGRQLPPFFVDGRELYERELERIILELPQ